MPDLIQKGEEGPWPAVFHNETIPLKYGYYIAKQPETEERKDGMIWQTARAKEKEFFNKFVASWPKRKEWKQWRDVKGWEDRLGTENLSKALSTVLSRMIANRFVINQLGS